MSQNASVLFDAPGPRARVRYRLLGALGALLIAAIVGVVAWKLNQQGQFEAAKWTPFVGSELWTAYLLPGLWGTLKAAAISIVLASVFGGVFALLRMSSIGPVRWVAGAIVEFFRAVPVLLMMIFSWGMYVRYDLVPSQYFALAGVVTALTLYNGSVICEVIRSGVDQLPKGQREAGLSIGLTRQQTLRTILLPQAVTAMLPSLVSQLVVILKDTALGTVITYPELLQQGQNLSSLHSNIFAALVVVAIVFIIVNWTLTSLAGLLERRLNRRGRTAGDAIAAAPTVVGAEADKP